MQHCKLLKFSKVAVLFCISPVMYQSSTCSTFFPVLFFCMFMFIYVMILKTLVCSYVKLFCIEMVLWRLPVFCFVCVCVCCPHGYSGSYQISPFALSAPRPGEVCIYDGLICSECKIWRKIVTLSIPPRSFPRGSVTDLQHYLLILFVGETFSRLICQHQLLSGPRCAEC